MVKPEEGPTSSKPKHTCFFAFAGTAASLILRPTNLIQIIHSNFMKDSCYLA